MTDFLRFVRRHQKSTFRQTHTPRITRTAGGEVRPLGTHTAYANGVPHLRTDCPWNVRPANATHIATRDACHRWQIDADKSDIFVVFAVAEIPRLSVSEIRQPVVFARLLT